MGEKIGTKNIHKKPNRNEHDTKELGKMVGVTTNGVE